MKKKVVIFVPGTKPVCRWPWVVREVVDIFAFKFKLNFIYDNYSKKWKRGLKLRGQEFVSMNWLGVSRLFNCYMKSKLKKLIDLYSDYEISLVGLSMGGNLVIDVLDEVDLKNIKKVVLVASVNNVRSLDFKRLDIVNIYSDEDSLIKLAMKFLFFNRGSKALEGKSVRNVDLPNVSHQGFCNNVEVKSGKFKGRKVLEVVRYFLTGKYE
jgi:hypothetical protein